MTIELVPDPAARQMLSEGVLPPEEFSREEVARILIDAYRKENR